MNPTAIKRINRALAYVCLIVASAFFMIPFIWLLSTSLKPLTQIFTFPPEWIPRPILWSNYSRAVEYIPFWTYLKNTAIITIVSTLGVIISCPLVAYSFAKLEYRGRGILFFVTLAVMMIPGQVTMIPLFLLFTKLGWVGTPLPLIVPQFFGVPIYIFLLRQFFMGLPDALREAARLDGASEFRIYLQIMFPLAKSAVLAVALFQFMGSWTDFMGPLLYLTNEPSYTVSLGLQQFQSQKGSEWGLLMAVSTLMTLPIIVLFFFLQKTFISGITFSGIKG
ncbi:MULTISPECIES: carbohydrate ABC transporter permease [Paenibacillus]|jgi:multiple sugar transport system permease protein|uniref:L-arabinose transport system permease protein AraQ n=1 Tax=Paenibacillus illinoisensis TaxID=59845 RepID=A0A2W0CPB1_9BACL|nr:MULTISPECIES: carbohydrate ABC transporter permease [Paenibacillus]MBD8840034.1 carbohydrate ABC transporter permease [Paenibacillus sp. CFBP 13594]MBY0216265.1 carbohydrate ABC transporter permease [Paenibacillus illinoisensis]MCF7755883.1 carbohydrate ABC transporter permease [Paenibacillus xylanexedens]PAD30030.1 sugar ABC transporter permease [Paenibacillus sp. 7523-1]PAF31086.1 sugar ABC transporter permease [Paenibacillus sp. 7516]